MPCLESFQLLAYIGFKLRRALHQFQPLHLLNGGHSRTERHGMRLIGVPMRKVVILKVVRDFSSGGAEAQRHVGRGDALGGDQNIRRDAPLLLGEPFAGASPSGHHLVANEKDAVTVTDLADAGKVFGRRNEYAISTNAWFDNQSRHIALVADHVLDVVGAGYIATRIGVLDGAVETV